MGIGTFSAFLYSTTCGFHGCPSIADIRGYVPSEGGRVLDRHGDLIGHLDPVRRITVPLDRIPERVQHAFIAVEDRRFLEHHGVDWRSVGRALWRDVTALGVKEGASTLTMQVARSAFLDEHNGDWSLGRKLIELRLAPRIEDALPKERILELYLNLIYLGEGTYGVEAASRHYFGKSVSRLSLAEAATLAALPRAPSVYDPRAHAARAVERRNLVLGLMVREGFISREDADQASRQRLRVARRGWSSPQRSSYAIEAARGVLDSVMKRRRWYGEITITTTFDRDAQAAAERAVRDRAAAIGKGVEGAAVALDPNTGEILAMVGGTGEPRGGFNRALLAHRQPGSAFKPFVYAAALRAGLTPATLVDDEPVEVENDHTIWRPANYGDDYLGRITLRTALAHSANAATVRVSEAVGVRSIADLARRLGIESRLNPVPSLALGSAEVTPLELVRAYAPFANGGWRVEPRFVTGIENGGRVLYYGAVKPRTEVLDSATAFLVTSMLRSVVDEGTGSFLRQVGVYGPAAGKTGTTNNGADVWFVGYTPTILAGFWFGYDTPRSMGSRASGGRLAAPAWASFYRRAWQDRETAFGWDAPDGVVEREIDPETGLLAGYYCPTTRLEWFREGTEPTEYCREHEGGWDRRIARFLVRVPGKVKEFLGRLFDGER
ncbi:MAG: penicillin-binding protein 1A [Gemmatimonadales bacterium]